MRVMGKKTVDDFNIGDFVIYKGEYAYVDDPDYEDNKVGILFKNYKMAYDDITKTYYPKWEYVDPNELSFYRVEEIDKESMMSFLRLEIDVWDLVKKHQIPIYYPYEPIELCEEDVNEFIKNINKLHIVNLNAWEDAFGHHSNVVYPYKSDTCMQGAFAWANILDLMSYFDFDYDELSEFVEKWEFYKKNKGVDIKDLDLSYGQARVILDDYDNIVKQFDIEPDFKDNYTYLLDILAKSDNIHDLNRVAYTYYGGNKVIPADWHKAEELLLKIYKKGDYHAANALGYIYYSNRLGEPNYSKAYYYFTKAAKVEIGEAIYKQADMIRKGHGTNQDPKKAFEIYSEYLNKELLAYHDGNYENDLADIALRVGYCYENGEGVEKDINKALVYFTLAKEAIEKRKVYGPKYGDEVVKSNIEKAIERVTSDINTII